MRVAILGDLHLGYAYDSARREDSFRQADEALSLANSSDLILLTGDIFDSRIPRQEVMARALRIFSEVKTPIVAIAGTHERRSKMYVNPVQMLEHAGFLRYLHLSSTEQQIDGKLVKIYGMSGVPERFAAEILKTWNPKPSGDINILLIHQNLKEYIYNPNEPNSLQLADLPPGFDLIVGGHIHWSDKTKAGKTPVLFPGSTIRTQLKKAETKPKAVWFFTPPGRLEQEPLKTQRKFTYKALDFKDATPSEIAARCKKEIEGIAPGSLIKLKLTGSLHPDFQPSDVDLRPAYSNIPKNTILSFTRSLTSAKQSVQKADLLALQSSSQSIEERGLEILRAFMKEDTEEIFHSLKDGDLEAAKEKILSRKPKGKA